MGGGPLTHISPVMREWQESRKAEVSAEQEIPAELKNTIETSMGRVWTTASKLVSTTVETVSQEADATVKAVIMERDEASAELQKSLADKELKVSEVQAELEKSRSKGEKLTSNNAAVTVRLEVRDEPIKGLNNDLKENRDDARALQAELLKIASKNNDFCLK
jgi:chromosome segregation ATPase